MKEEDRESINIAMWRCDRALGNIIGNRRPLKRHVEELASATHNLLNVMRVVENSMKYGLNGYPVPEPQWMRDAKAE